MHLVAELRDIWKGAKEYMIGLLASLASNCNSIEAIGQQLSNNNNDTVIIGDTKKQYAKIGLEWLNRLTCVINNDKITLDENLNLVPDWYGILHPNREMIYNGSILNKYKEAGKEAGTAAILPAHSESEKALMLELTRFNAMMENAYEETAPHKVCSYIYDLANALNHFYHETKIMAEEDEAVQASYVRLLTLTRRTLEVCIDVLGFSAPDRM